MLRDIGEHESARSEYEEALSHNPKYVPARVLLGVTLFALGHRADAEQAWKTALEHDPDNKLAQMYLRMIHGNTLQSLPPPRPNVSSMEEVFRLAESRPDIQAPPPDKVDE
jgi:tetratricopeptide (TPR) repeat protein